MFFTYKNEQGLMGGLLLKSWWPHELMQYLKVQYLSRLGVSGKMTALI